MSDVTQQVFYGGEISTIVASRLEIPKRAQSVEKMQNTFPHKHGAMSNRGGTQMLAPASVYSGNCRRIPFVYNNDDTYTIEITDQKFRFIRNSGYVLQGLGLTVSGVVYSTDVITTSGAHGLVIGDFVFFQDNTGAGHYKFVETVPTTSTLTLKNHDGTSTDLIDNSGTETETIDRIYSISTDYVDADIPLLKYKQKADTMTITHRNYFPQELTRSGHTAWTISRPNFEPTLNRPTGVVANATSDNDQHYYAFNLIEDRKVKITGMTAGSPTVVTFEIVDAAGVSLAAAEDNNLFEGRLICMAGGTFGGVDAVAAAAKLDGPNIKIRNRTHSGGADAIYTCDLYGLGGAPVDTSTLTFTYTSDTSRYGSKRLVYKVSAVDKDGRESFPSVASAIIASDTLGDDRPASVVWVAPTGYTVEDYYVYKEDNEVFGFIGSTQIPATGVGSYFNDRNIAPELGDNPQEEPMHVPFYTNLEAGGISNANPVSINSIKHRRKAGDRVIIESDHAEFVNAAYFVRAVADDDNYTIEDANGDPIDGSAWVGVHTTGFEADYPASCVYFRQRRGFASKFNARQEVNWSATGQDSTFSRSSDAFTYKIDEAEANEIRHLLSGSDMLAFTGGSVVLSSSGDNRFAADTVDNIEQMSAGIDNLLEPLKMRNSLIYVQDKVSQVFDLAYTFEQNKYLGQDLTILASHLVDTKRIVSWAYQSVPEPIVWCVMDDGSMIGLLYERDNNIFGWHVHSTNGLFKDVCVQPEGEDESLHLVVQRTIDGEDRLYHERLWNRQFTYDYECRFLDAHVTKDTHTDITAIAEEAGVSDGIKVTSATHGLVDNDLIEIDATKGSTELNRKKYLVAEATTNDFYLVNRYLTAKANITSIELDGTDVKVTHDGTLTVTEGDAIFLEGTSVTDGSNSVDSLFFYANWLSTTTFRLMTFGNVLYNGSAWTGLTATVGTIRVGTITDKATVTAYISDGEVRKCVSTLYGLDHLEGETVQALCDGNVVTDNAGVDLVVANGCLALGDSYARIHVGLAYVSEVKTLTLDTPNSELSGEVRSVEAANLKLNRTRGLQIGPSTDKLVEIRNRTTEGWNENTQLLTGETTVDCHPLESNLGSMVLQQTYPLPFTVQAIGLDVSVGEGD